MASARSGGRFMSTTRCCEFVSMRSRIAATRFDMRGVSDGETFTEPRPFALLAVQVRGRVTDADPSVESRQASRGQDEIALIRFENTQEHPQDKIGIKLAVMRILRPMRTRIRS